jgi:hypothetical protein
MTESTRARFRDLLQRVSSRGPAASAPGAQNDSASESIRARFCTEMPSAQMALDDFKGAWKSKPPGNLSSGDQERFADTRVEWFMKTAELGTLEGQRILELGPFEAYNTYQFCKFGATDVTAIEGNTINFLKCLVIKEVLGFGYAEDRDAVPVQAGGEDSVRSAAPGLLHGVLVRKNAIGTFRGIEATEGA